jgi:hypothetical protein
MLDTMTRYLEAVHPRQSAYALKHAFEAPIDRLSSQAITTAGLVITGAGGTTAKIGAADFYAIANGTLVKITAGTAMPALTGVNFAAGHFTVVAFYVNAAGVVTMLPGTSGLTLAGVVFPAPLKNQALIGYLIITNAGAFTGGTTALDTATTVYVSGTFTAVDPTALTG